MYEFSPETRRILYKNGWDEQRKVNIDEYKEFLSKWKQPTSEIILDFLRSFGGLAVSKPTKKPPHIMYDVFEINPTIAGILKLPEYSMNWIHKPLCGVGIVDSIETLAMTPEGELYTIFDSHVNKIGNNVPEAIEHLCLEGTSAIRILKSKQNESKLSSILSKLTKRKSN